MEENARLRKLLKRPLQTEKVVNLQEEHNVYTFEVPGSANKIEIRRAVEVIFDVKVVDVRTVTVHGKLKRLGRYLGRRPSTKKAYVVLEPGASLELYENV